MNKPKVSVVLIVRNGEKYLSDALTSVVEQTYENLELMVIDGHSEDKSIEIAKGFKLATVFSQPNLGIANAYNYGIGQCNSDFIAFISSDDIWEKRKIELQLLEFERNPSLDFSVTQFIPFLEKGEDIPSGFRSETLGKPQIGLIMETLLTRKSTFKKVGYFDSKFRIGEDTDWFARCIDAKLNYTCLSMSLLMKRVHSNNAHLQAQDSTKLILRALHDSILRKKRSTDKGT